MLVTTAQAVDVDTSIKQQCQHLVYGNGSHNIAINSYMTGTVNGQAFKTPNQADFVNTATLGKVAERACKEALADNSASDFEIKFQRGISVTIDKNFIKHRKVH